MGILHIISERGGDEDLHRYKKALRMAKQGIETICDLSEDMEDQYGERDYGERYGSRGYRSRGGYSRRDERERDDMDERRYRDSRGRYM